MNSDELQALLEQMSALLQDMHQALADERAALEGSDVEALADATARKTEVCEALAQPRYGQDLHDAMLALSAAEREKLEPHHNSVLTQAANVRDSNLVNGKVIARSQNNLREILHLLGGKSIEGLYGQSGQPTAGPDRNGPKIAKA